MPNKKNLIFSATHFRYIKSTNDLIPDSLYFVQDAKKYEVIFDENLGWYRTVERHPFKHSCDKILGRVIGDSKIFKIMQGDTTTKWVYHNVPFENIII